MEALPFVNMGDSALRARNVEALVYEYMGDDAIVAKNVASDATRRCPKCPLEHRSANWFFVSHYTITPECGSRCDRNGAPSVR